jgi:signal peptidase II
MRWIGIFSLIGLAVFCDQLSKWWVGWLLQQGESIEILPGFFDLHLVMNEGAAFGLFASLPDIVRRISLIVVAVVALVVVGRLLLSSKGDTLTQYSLGLILGGAIGNIIDRFRYDAVVDFLDFYIGEYRWPTFNVADSCISLGVFFLLLQMFVHSRRKSAEKCACSVSPSS